MKGTLEPSSTGLLEALARRLALARYTQPWLHTTKPWLHLLNCCAHADLLLFSSHNRSTQHAADLQLRTQCENLPKLTWRATTLILVHLSQNLSLSKLQCITSIHRHDDPFTFSTAVQPPSGSCLNQPEQVHGTHAFNRRGVHTCTKRPWISYDTWCTLLLLGECGVS
jgi:hypothetical protein